MGDEHRHAVVCRRGGLRGRCGCVRGCPGRGRRAARRGAAAPGRWRGRGPGPRGPAGPTRARAASTPRGRRARPARARGRRARGTGARSTPRLRGPKATLSRARRCGKSRLSASMRPTPRCSGASRRRPSSQTSPPTRTWPSARGSTPARASTVVVLPPPLGPRTPMTWPGAAVEATSTSIAPRDRRTRASSPDAGDRPLGRWRHRSHRPRSTPSTSTLTREQHDADRDRHLRVALELDVDEQRQGLRAAREVAGEGDRRTELAERPRPRERETARDAGQHERDADRAEVAQVARSERPRHRLEPWVEAAHRALDGQHVVGHRDEGLGEHDGHGRERDLDAEGRQVLPDDPVASPCHEQGHAADDRRQHERNREQGAHPARRRGARTGPGTRPGECRAAGTGRPSPRSSSARAAVPEGRSASRGRTGCEPSRRGAAARRGGRRAAARASAAGTPRATRERHRAAYLMSRRPSGGRRARDQGAPKPNDCTVASPLALSR